MELSLKISVSKVLKAVAIADIHGSVAYVKQLTSYVNSHNIHYVLIAGDVAVNRDNTTFNRIVKEILFNTHAKIIYVRGETDPLIEYGESNVLNVEHKQYAINEINIIGIPPFLDYELKLPIEGKIKAHVEHLSYLSKTAHEKKILLTHIPPYGLNVDKHPLKGNIGSVELRDFIEKTQPHIVICGHVHSGMGIDSIRNTVVLNPGPFRRGYFVEFVVYASSVAVKLSRFTLPFET